MEGRCLVTLRRDEILFVRGNTAAIAVVKVGESREFLVETPRKEVYQFATPDDLIVASGFGSDDKMMRGLRCVLFMIRELNMPLIVLPKEHPATKRLRTVVSVGGRVVLSCDITPGTHPEQHLLCASPEFHGAEIVAVDGGVELIGFRSLNCHKESFIRATSAQ
ncbi:hypothetical protein DRN79_04580 [Methanosarcinales archaeon]|nr:MAG: hypothetical protein DRN79_04580 [Methanosarcinales archaeon]